MPTLIQARRTHRDSHRTRILARLIDWQFEKGSREVSCVVAARGAHLFDVMLSTCSSGARVSSERFHDAGAALLRHAVIADRLRGDGWQLTRYSPVAGRASRPPAAARG